MNVTELIKADLASVADITAAGSTRLPWKVEWLAETLDECETLKPYWDGNGGPDGNLGVCSPAATQAFLTFWYKCYASIERLRRYHDASSNAYADRIAGGRARESFDAVEAAEATIEEEADAARESCVEVRILTDEETEAWLRGEEKVQ
jgi:hypothetical protein